MDNNIWHLTGVMEENFNDYKLPSMLISTGFCDDKCSKDLFKSKYERGCSLCHNDKLVETTPYTFRELLETYTANIITKALVIAGKEPMKEFYILLELVKYFRTLSSDDIVIYTGYNKFEVLDKIKELEKFPNIIVKYGRWIPYTKKIYDEVLGIELWSCNQYAERLDNQNKKIGWYTEKEFEKSCKILHGEVL